MKRLVAIFMVSILTCRILYAATTGATGGNTAAETGGVWSTITNILASSGSDDNRAIHQDTGTGNELIVTNFGFSITAGATIDNIEIRVEGHGSAASANNRRINGQLTKDGSTGVGDNPTLTPARDTDNDANFSPATDGLWGLTWTVPEINSSNFGVIILKNASSFDAVRLDFLTANITYTISADVGRRKKILLRSSPGGTPEIIKVTEYEVQS